MCSPATRSPSSALAPSGSRRCWGRGCTPPSAVVAVDLADARLEVAREFGATSTVNNGREDALEVVHGLTGGLGADVVIEAVGVPASFELCTQLVRPGGHVANVGVHGKPASLHLEELWAKDVTITTGLVDTYSTPTLLRLVTAGQVDAAKFATHRFQLDEFMSAYDTFSRAAETGALKVVVRR